jgi:hypothetical protein
MQSSPWPSHVRVLGGGLVTALRWVASSLLARGSQSQAHTEPRTRPIQQNSGAGRHGRCSVVCRAMRCRPERCLTIFHDRNLKTHPAGRPRGGEAYSPFRRARALDGDRPAGHGRCASWLAGSATSLHAQAGTARPCARIGPCGAWTVAVTASSITGFTVTTALSLMHAAASVRPP